MSWPLAAGGGVAGAWPAFGPLVTGESAAATASTCDLIRKSHSSFAAAGAATSSFLFSVARQLQLDFA